jgi:hypothetical protein
LAAQDPPEEPGRYAACGYPQYDCNWDFWYADSSIHPLIGTCPENTGTEGPVHIYGDCVTVDTQFSSCVETWMSWDVYIIDDPLDHEEVCGLIY